jgi:uncharacterized membrane protein YeaQ/YmgE (transglycosylase-associated protein family)
MLSTFLLLLYVDQIFGVVIDRGFVSWVFLGLIAGWLAGKIARGRGYGCLTDILLGLIGSVLGGWIFRKLEIGAGHGGWLYSLAAATVGAVLLVVVVHLFTGGSKE